MHNCTTAQLRVAQPHYCTTASRSNCETHNCTTTQLRVAVSRVCMKNFRHIAEKIPVFGRAEARLSGFPYWQRCMTGRGTSVSSCPLDLHHSRPETPHHPLPLHPLLSQHLLYFAPSKSLEIEVLSGAGDK
ncbi:hypothetical protein PISMIDRAFT_492057 [Pisolithus microcarpus 441]|uniref:Uncharacterized protein n=1 Tax=Pisolithus microcarpus 441 TaxID=765257 RepID=A0A0C9YMS9_9AGAM|nr:hypothetical protein PISMIDRAFT_492057 [Pisolithus microcarpus 441]